MKKNTFWPFVSLLVLVACSTAPKMPSRESYKTPQDNMRAPAAASSGSVDETVTIDGKAEEKAFPHFWEQAFGSGRAILTTRDAYRRQLSMMKKATGLQYVRFHEIFSDEVGVYSENDKGVPSYNWTYVDEIYDGLLALGVRPIVEISYMPSQLAMRSGDRVLWNQTNVSPPKDYMKWEDLVRHFTQHLVDRYGLEEVTKWYFEVWNEAQFNWTGQPAMETYFELYDHTAPVVKSVSSQLRVGGPVSAAAGWIDEFIDHVTRNHLPVDFISSHGYADDQPKYLFGKDEDIPMHKRVCLAIKQTHDKIRRSPLPNLPLLWTEWSVPSYGSLNARDSIYVGAGLAETVRQCDGLVDMMAYWTFSDVFDEAGVMSGPFTGWFGLISVNGVQKPGFHGFELLHRLGERRLKNDSPNVIVTRRADGGLSIAAWNLVSLDQTGPTQKVHFQFQNIKPNMKIQILRVDENHSNTRGIYKAMGEPINPTQAQIADINKRGALQAERADVVGGKLDIEIPPNGLVLIETPKLR